MLAQTYVSSSHENQRTTYIQIKGSTCCCPQQFGHHFAIIKISKKNATGQDQDLQRQAWFRYLGKREFVVMKSCFCWAGSIKWDPIWWNQT